MTNFNHFLSAPQFTPFGEVAVAAEKIYAIDPAACVLNCRRSMEFAVKWMYSVDNELVMPYDDRLVSLMDAEDFRDIVGEDLWRRLKYIRQTGNAASKAVHLLWHHQCRVRLPAGHHGQPSVLAGQNAGRRRKALLGTHP